jgi:hypothetical protein
MMRHSYPPTGAMTGRSDKFIEIFGWVDRLITPGPQSPGAGPGLTLAIQGNDQLTGFAWPGNVKVPAS